MNRYLTLAEHIAVSLVPSCDNELTSLLITISETAKTLSRRITTAGLTGMLGSTGTENIQGEDVQHLDAFADHQFTFALQQGTHCAGIAGEEKEHIIPFEEQKAMNSSYVVMFDPLDGSSNISTHLPVGTIFGIYRRKTQKGKPCNLTDFLQPGHRQVAAGYILYGCATVFVYTNGKEVNGFTLDDASGQFLLSHPRIQCPQTGTVYSVNHGYFRQYDRNMQRYITTCAQPPDGRHGCSQRYVGSMVADVHQVLLKGGIFLYPGTQKKPYGKLRLLYECNPLAFLMETAGGMATNRKSRILDIQPASLHEVTPVYIGSQLMISCLLRILG